MDFGRLVADPIMRIPVVNSLFFSSRRHGRFSLHSVQCDARAVRPKVIFFHVFWLLTDAILHRWGALFGRQIGSPKHKHSKTAQNVQREKRTPNLSIPLSLVRRRVEIADDCSTRVALLKICAFSRNRSKSQQKCLIFRIGKMNQNIARSALWTFFCRRPKAPK